MNFSSVQLQSGHCMPMIGLGTWQSTAKEVEAAVARALEVGYRHIDTAWNYDNEEAIGRALKLWFDEGKGKREELFITTKLPNIGNRACDVEKYLSISLRRLQLDYIDLYLIHMPFGFFPNEAGDGPAKDADGNMVLDCDTDHIAMWKALEAEVDAGRIRSLGLSNFNCKQIERVMENACHKPSVLQVELHGYHQQAAIRKCCSTHGIQVTAYSPLGSPTAKNHFSKKYNYEFSPDTVPVLLNNPKVVKIAERYKRTPGQILLRHHIQQGIVAIPKSTSAQRIKQNFEVFDFELDCDAMADLNELDRGGEGRILTFLFFKGVERHPEYPFKE